MLIDWRIIELVIQISGRGGLMVLAVAMVKVQNQAGKNWNSDEGLNDTEVTRSVCEC